MFPLRIKGTWQAGRGWGHYAVATTDPRGLGTWDGPSDTASLVPKDLAFLPSHWPAIMRAATQEGV